MVKVCLRLFHFSWYFDDLIVNGFFSSPHIRWHLVGWHSSMTKSFLRKTKIEILFQMNDGDFCAAFPPQFVSSRGTQSQGHVWLDAPQWCWWRLCSIYYESIAMNLIPQWKFNDGGCPYDQIGCKRILTAATNDECKGLHEYCQLMALIKSTICE